MRLVLVRELTGPLPFYDTVLFLQLEEKELDDFINLCKEEIRIRQVEDERVKRTLDRQMAMMINVDWSSSGDEWGRIFDEEAARVGEVKMPSTFSSEFYSEALCGHCFVFYYMLTPMFYSIERGSCSCQELPAQFQIQRGVS
jgi:hypothetical protein